MIQLGKVPEDTLKPSTIQWDCSTSFQNDPA